MIHNKRGFTLAELLAVVLIIAVLAAIALPQYRRSIRRAQAVEGLTHLRAVMDSALRYKAEYETAPTKFGDLDVAFQNVSGGVIDNFKFTFNGSTSITACYAPNGSCTGYTFTGYYDNSAYGGKGALTCEYSDDKYQTVCDAVGTIQSGKLYVIK